MIDAKPASRRLWPFCVGLMISLLSCLAASNVSGAEIPKAVRVSGPFGSITALDDGRARQVLAAVRAVRRDSRRFLGVRGVRFQFLDQDLARLGKPAPGRPDDIPFTWEFPKQGAQSNESSQFLIGLIRHELGHQVFLRRVLVPSSDGTYGSDAPDWLDEAAAIVMETPEMKDQRRAMARMLAAQGKLFPLGDFLAMSHPEAKSGVDRLASASSNGTFVPKNPFQTLIFYSQCQVFTDFLISKSGEPAILRKLADAIGRNEDYVALLMEELAIGAGQHSLDEINSMFLLWVREHTAPGGLEKIG